MFNINLFNKKPVTNKKRLLSFVLANYFCSFFRISTFIIVFFVYGAFGEDIGVPLLRSPYDMNEVGEPIKVDYSKECTQIMRASCTNTPYTEEKDSISFVKSHLKDAVEIDTDVGILKYASDSVVIKDGFYMEFGVGVGQSINFLAALNPKKTIYGFDSFEGLPEDWGIFPKGSFGLHGSLPRVLHNVGLIKGWYDEVLPLLNLGDKPISLIHIDCDIYSSTKSVFTLLNKNIVPGTIILFDEFYNYPGYEEHEYKAFVEFLNSRQDITAEYLAFNPKNKQVLIKIVPRYSS